MTRDLIASSLQARISARRPVAEILHPNSPDTPEVHVRPLSTNTRGPVAWLLPPAPPKPQKGQKR
jgi:hypothetical protein